MGKKTDTKLDADMQAGAAAQDAAPISDDDLRAGGLEVGPILMGLRNQAHIVTPSITARGLLNMAAIAGVPVANYG